LGRFEGYGSSPFGCVKVEGVGLAMSKMKWLKNLFSTADEPDYSQAYRLPNIFEEERLNREAGSSSRPNEELDRAIALSLVEEDHDQDHNHHHQSRGKRFLDEHLFSAETTPL
jgi:hypothetical protein